MLTAVLKIEGCKRASGWDGEGVATSLFVRCRAVGGACALDVRWRDVTRPSSSVVQLAVMSDTDTISVSQLIELVRDRPVLWDRQKEVYKNRKLTRKAWVDICETLIENYDELSDQEQKAIGECFL